MTKKRKAFLFRLNLADVNTLAESLRNDTGSSGTVDTPASSSGATRPPGQERQEPPGSSSSRVEDSSAQASVPTNRADAPKVDYALRGSKSEALRAASTQEFKQHALKNMESDISARSTTGTLVSYWKTWKEFHTAWFGESDPLPLTPNSVASIGAMFKAGGYRSFQNYLGRAKDEHIARGFG